MLRYLALLIAVVFGLLAQAGPSMAHAYQSVPVATVRDMTEISGVPVHEEGCGSKSGCCEVMCAPCYLSLPAQQNGFASVLPRSSRLMVPRQDCLGSIILGRDPPIPRNFLL